MNHQPDRFAEDLEIVDTNELFHEIVLSDDASAREFLKTQWIERILNQLVSSRIEHGLTQREVGERIGKPQSSIGRLETGSDMKLSTLWEYLSALGQAPAAPLHVQSLDDDMASLRRYSVRRHPRLSGMLQEGRHEDEAVERQARAG